MPFLSGLGVLVGAAVFKFGKGLFKFAVFASFIGLLVMATVVFWDFYHTVYAKIQGSIDGLGHSYGGLLGCIINALGIDTFMTSALAIFTSASVFWGVSAGYIVAFKYGRLAYTNLLRIL